MHRISELFTRKDILSNSAGEGDDVLVCSKSTEGRDLLEALPVRDGDAKVRVNIIAMGDVGGTVLLGLRLLGEKVIESIGIFDLNSAATERYEREINQVSFPDGRVLPQVRIIESDECFDCDVFVFCATKAIPPLGADGDVRMAQFEANRGLVELYAKMALEAGFKGLFAVVSDPVDPLCMAAARAGLDPAQIKGYGLGVMYARGLYAAGELGVDAAFRINGRAFGPHGADLVIADNVFEYDDKLSAELTERAVTSNLVTRESGFKPYIAPAMSSAAISLIETISGGWHYSSVFTGEVFLGCRNRVGSNGIVIENLPLCDRLYSRIEKACMNLSGIISYGRE